MRNPLVLVIVLLATLSARAGQPSADELVRAVLESEQWIHRVKSFQVRLEGEWTKTPEAIARAKKLRSKEFPGEDLSEKKWPEFRAHAPESITLAFDDERLFKHDLRPGDCENVSLFDGSRSWHHEKYFNHEQEHYAYQSGAERMGELFLLDMTWLRAGPHRFWWNKQAGEHGYRFDQDGAQRWRIVGREKYHGVDCWTLEKEYGWTQWRIGAGRPLLHEIITYVSKSGADETPIQIESAKKFGATNVDSEKSFETWIGSLPREKRNEFNAIYVPALKKIAYPLVVERMLDYKEVAPGNWMPMLQEYDIYEDEGGPTIVSGTRTLRVTDVKVDQPLPPELFNVEMREGVQVNDWSHDPPLIYKHKKNFTDAEWAAIVDKALAQANESKKRKADLAAVVGRAAPAFPAECEWINVEGAAPSLDSLKGQVVVVDFFADWCGPCRNDLPRMAQMFKDREKLPFTVMAIHPAGSNRGSIDKIIKEFELGYPICIDLPSEKAWGKLYDAYRVNAIPHAVVIDKGGRIAAQGSLGEMVRKAHELAK